MQSYGTAAPHAYGQQSGYGTTAQGYGAQAKQPQATGYGASTVAAAGSYGQQSGYGVAQTAGATPAQYGAPAAAGSYGQQVRTGGPELDGNFSKQLLEF